MFSMAVESATSTSFTGSGSTDTGSNDAASSASAFGLEIEEAQRQLGIASRDAPSGQGTQVAETVFMGGAGDRGVYKQDMVRALSDAGIANVRATDPPITLGYGLLGDGLAVTQLNQDSGYLMMPNLVETAGKKSAAPNEQYNLVGYSFGAAIMAQHALYEAELRKNKVDNLVLIGAPINQSLVGRLERSPNIGNVTYINLDAHGDPIYPGMNDAEIVASSPKLGYQMLFTGSGHFYYSQENAEGAKRRDALARKLFESGVR
jgi:pimeloyl-ACP methyl ester carboxylesterase